MAHPQNNFTSQFRSDGSDGNAALTLQVNGENHVYTPQGTDLTVELIEPIVFEASENPTYAEVTEAIGTHAPVYIHISGVGVDYMIPYVGQSDGGDKLHFEMPDAQADGIRYYIIRNGASPEAGVSGNAATATHLSASASLDTWAETYDVSNPFVLAAEITWELEVDHNNGAGQLLQFEFTNSDYVLIRLNYITKGGIIDTAQAVVLNSTFSDSDVSDLIRITHFKYDSDTKFAVRVYLKFTGDWQVWSIRQLDAQSGDEGYTNWVPMTLHSQHGSNVAAPTGTSATYVFPLSDRFAAKAPSGNGNLAVIDSNGNYVSSGISAYSQSQINALISNSVAPQVEAASYVKTQSFFIKVTQNTTGHALQFQNAYTGDKLLQLTLNYRYDVGTVELALRMDLDWNSWIKAGAGGGTFVTANGTKHTVNSGTDTVTPFFDYTETSIASTATGDVVIGTFDIGQSSVYDTNSYYDFIMNIFNLDSSTSVTLKITLMTERIANPGIGTWATLIGMATLDATELGAN